MDFIIRCAPSQNIAFCAAVRFSELKLGFAKEKGSDGDHAFAR
jgi:hypothetical protein